MRAASPFLDVARSAVSTARKPPSLSHWRLWRRGWGLLFQKIEEWSKRIGLGQERREPRHFVEQFSSVLDSHLDYEHFCRIWSCIFTESLVPESMLEGLAAHYGRACRIDARAWSDGADEGTVFELALHE